VTVGGVLSEAWGLYRLLWRRSILTAAAIFVFLSLVEALITRPGLSKGAAALLLLVSAILSIVGSLWVQGALVEVVRELREGRPAPSFERLYDMSRGQLWRLAAGGLITGIGVALGLIFFIVPGLVLWTRWSLIVPVIVVEQQPVGVAFDRSSRLVRGHGWTVFGVIATTLLVTLVIGAITQEIFRPLPRFFSVWVAGVVGASIATPYVAHAFTVLYYRLLEPDRPVIPR
jgi:hypothetical protein